ncbi:MAG: type II toxin-antitoxin system PemK/MazF family toxin [Gammaproteobacteria bacterium]|nr:type II toxin-antitoxin system PemK/MazF family toxin [Gammaproteobacteria bacterium]
MEMVDESLNRFDVWLVLKNPEKGRVVENLGLCTIISPDELNTLPNRIVAPMTTECEKLHSRVECLFDNSKGYIMLDQMRVVDKLCFVKKLGKLESDVHVKLCDCLQEFFAL